MKIPTTRFGRIEFQGEDVIHFPAGILGMESCCRWILLADAENDALGWLQSTDRADTALALVSPRRFVPQYQIRVARRDLAVLQVDSPQEVQVLSIVGKSETGPTLNLKAPLVFNLAKRLGTQVVARNELPLHYELSTSPPPMRRSA